MLGIVHNAFLLLSIATAAAVSYVSRRMVQRTGTLDPALRAKSGQNVWQSVFASNRGVPNSKHLLNDAELSELNRVRRIITTAFIVFLLLWLLTDRDLIFGLQSMFSEGTSSS
jgi:hypothetical protein